MGRTLVVLMSILLIALILSNAVIVRPIAPLVLLLVIGVITGLALFAAYEYVQAQTAYEKGFQAGVNQQYASDVDNKTRYDVLVYSSGLYNKLLMMDDSARFYKNYTYSYFLRLADSIAASAYVGNISLDEAKNELKESIYKIFTKTIYPIAWTSQDAYRLDLEIGKERKEAGLHGLSFHVGSTGGSGIGYKDTATGIVTASGFNAKIYVSNLIIAQWSVSNNSIQVYSFDQVSNVYDIIADVDFKVTVYYSDGSSIVLEDLVYFENGTGSNSVSSENIIKNSFIQWKTIYNDAETELVNYYNTLQQLKPDPSSLPPPPSVILPYDPKLLDKMSPEARLALYHAYLKYLADWANNNDTRNRIDKITPDVVEMVNQSVVINGTVWIGDTRYDGLMVPIDVGGKMVLSRGINKLRYFLYVFMISWDNRTMHPLTVPENSTLLIYNILVNGTSVDKVSIGRTTARNFTYSQLAQSGALKKIIEEAAQDYFSQLWERYRLWIIVGGFMFMVLVLLALASGGRGGVVVVRG